MTRSKFDIILYGGPGAGKGTQAKILVTKLNAAHLGMGQQIRRFTQTGTPEADAVKSIVARGELVPTSVTKKIATEFIQQVPVSQRIVFDGYPRSIEQVETLDELLAAQGRDVRMIYITLPDEVVAQRLLKRARIEHRADDLDETVINHRLEVFHQEAKNLIEYYKTRNQFSTVDGNQSIEAVASDIAKVIESC